MQIQQKRHRKKSNKQISSKVIAKVAGVSEHTAKSVLSGRRNENTDAGQRVILADSLLNEQWNGMVKAVTQILNKSGKGI